MQKNCARKRRPPTAWTDLSRFSGIQAGRRCFVVGAGPSLAFLNLDGIQDYTVIAVNSAALLMPWSRGEHKWRFWLSNDILCMKWDYFWSHVLKASCTKIVRTSWKKRDDEISGYGFQYFAPRKHDTVIDSSGGGLCAVSSIPTATDFALLMGCNPIYLLGVDQRMVHDNSHFWQFWDRSKWPQRLDKEKYFRPEQKHQAQIFDQNVSVFKALDSYAIKNNIRIFNCNPRSQLDVFPKISFEESLFNRGKKTPLACPRGSSI